MIGWMRFTINFLLYFIFFWVLAVILLMGDKACAQALEQDTRGPDLLPVYESTPPRRPPTKADRLWQWDQRFYRAVKAMCFYGCALDPIREVHHEVHLRVQVKEPPGEWRAKTPRKLLKILPVKVVAEQSCNAITLGEFNALTVSRVLACLPENGDFSIVVDGPGSRVDDLLHLLKGVSEWRAKGHKLTCVVKEEADSGNAYFFESPECDVREIYTNGKLGIHHMVLTIIHSSMSIVQLQELLKDALTVENMLYRLVATRIVGGPSETMVEVLRNMVEAAPEGLLMFTSWQAIAINLVDKVVRP